MTTRRRSSPDRRLAPSEGRRRIATIATVLIVDSDPKTFETVSAALPVLSFRVVAATSGAQAITRSSEHAIDCAVIEHRLDDTTGTDLIRALRASRAGLPCVLFGEHFAVSTVVEAMRLGAEDVVEKPFDIQQLLATVSSAAARSAKCRIAAAVQASDLRPDRSLDTRSVAARWVQHVLAACEDERDPKTLGKWARLAGVSYTSLCERCRILGIRPHHARDFARVLRALLLASRHNCAPEALLDVGDQRTLRTMLTRAGVKSVADFRNYSIAKFFTQQSFVDADNNEGLKQLTAAFAAVTKS